MRYNFREEPSLERAVTFILNKSKPIYNWFYFKEGFSKELVDYCIDRYDLHGTILDPFCGSGTTLLVAKERKMNAIGIDISPLACFVSKVKTRNYDIGELKKEFEKIRQLKPTPKEEIRKKWLKEYFYGKTLGNIYFYKEKFEELENEVIKNFFMLALIDSTDKVANAIKQGASLRKIKKPPIPIKSILINKIKRMIRDLEKSNETILDGIEPKIINGDARIINIEENSIDAVITSPPYLNKIEYTKVYKIELAIFFDHQETSLRSFIGDEAKEIKEGRTIAEAYFKDMRMSLEKIYLGLREGGKVIIDIAGGCFPDRNIQSDEIIADISQEIGFKCKEIVIAREINCHRERTFRTGKVRESLVVLEK
ncbi:MAG: site-specific DNA-methyltransferase [Candidatus Diapherotrites archaeon]|nr:site-specific DNA-methyltransferase [Candidatus Diapherotrites archaeon]